MSARPGLAWSPGAAGPLCAEPEPETAATWQEYALCAESDGDAWFPEEGQPNSAAKAICRLCEVREECLEYALANDEAFGIWGGLSEHERRRLGRPADGQPGEHRCLKGLHALAGSGSCRACKKAADRARHRRLSRNRALGVAA